MNVEVSLPLIVNDTVHFSWTQSEPNPFQRKNAFSFRYQGIDLNQFTNSLFYEIFLGLQLKVFAHDDTPVEIVFPEPVSPYTVAFWQTYHQAAQVTISPIAESGTYAPWKTARPLVPKRPYGALFGGGKDSTLAACLLSEIYGPDQVVLFQLVHPFRSTPEEAARIEHRQNELMLQPIRQNLGVATQHAFTDYIANMTAAARKLRPHLELYTVGFLPALLSLGASFLTTSFPWSAFPFRRLSNGGMWFRYDKSRPEMLATQSAHYLQGFAMEITLTNVNLLFTPVSTFRLLAERYPHILPQIVMCVYAESGQQWCYKCYKCAEYGLYGLACGVIDPRFDYTRVFTASKFIRQIIAYAESGVERSSFGNAPWQPFFGNIGNYQADCHAVAKIPIELIAPHLSSEALGNFLMLKAVFGNTLFPTAEKIPASAIAILNHETARQMAVIAAEHFEIVDRLEGPFVVGGLPVEYDFTVRSTPETSKLEHLRV